MCFRGRGKRPLSNMAMAMLLARMGHTDITVHGFRSAFRDWAAETTAFPREVCEAALAHINRDKVEASYRRGDLHIVAFACIMLKNAAQLAAGV
jgi:integrase